MKTLRHKRKMGRRRIEPKIKYYFLFNKPSGTVCSTVSDSHKTVFEFFPDDLNLHTVGRLDKDTEGLLIVTNDGKFSNFLSRPENKIKKTYFVRLKNDFSNQMDFYKKAAETGVVLPPEKKAGEQKSSPFELAFPFPAEKQQPQTELEITVTEGKFHEVKRIFRALGNEVIYLKRTGLSFLKLDENLECGTWRELTPEEIQMLSAGILI